MFCFLQADTQIRKLYDLFLKVDATQIEINPFAETLDGQGKGSFTIIDIYENVHSLRSTLPKSVL